MNSTRRFRTLTNAAAFSTNVSTLSITFVKTTAP
jgi:hypothetical protein